MKLKVLKRFHDKVTGDCYNIGDAIDVSDERGKEILSAAGGLAERIDGEEQSEHEVTDGDKPKGRNKKKK